jgi:hypothetical protein
MSLCWAGLGWCFSTGTAYVVAMFLGDGMQLVL